MTAARGGGRVTITASDAVIVNGTIRANGGESAGSAAGDGSGGAILIRTSRIGGTGFISANGGGNGTGTAGGGGRVAVYCDYVEAHDNLDNLYNITAFGGHGQYDSRQASAGTVYVRYSDQEYGDLYIDDNVVDGVGNPSGTAAVSTELPHIGFWRHRGITRWRRQRIVRHLDDGRAGAASCRGINRPFGSIRIVARTKHL